MSGLYEKLQESTAYLKTIIKGRPRIALILGSGLGSLISDLVHPVEIPYTTIPHFPQSTVAGHAGCLVYGNLNGIDILIMNGRPHYYEGYTMQQVAFPVLLMKFLEIETLLITNACGGINRGFVPGTLMILTDFINLVTDNPLIGINDERIGPRFPDMSEPYSSELITAAKNTAEELGIDYREGVYAGFMGPYYETAAEIRAIHVMGADAVGMSTVPETIAANYAGLKCFAVACITNMATGIQTMKHSHERVLEVAQRASGDLRRWITELVSRI